MFLAAFIYGAYLVTPEWVFHKFNENPHYSNIKPQPNNCRFIDTDKSNIKYTCN